MTDSTKKAPIDAEIEAALVDVFLSAARFNLLSGPRVRASKPRRWWQLWRRRPTDYAERFRAPRPTWYEVFAPPAAPKALRPFSELLRENRCQVGDMWPGAPECLRANGFDVSAKALQALLDAVELEQAGWTASPAAPDAQVAAPADTAGMKPTAAEMAEERVAEPDRDDAIAIDQLLERDRLIFALAGVNAECAALRSELAAARASARRRARDPAGSRETFVDVASRHGVTAYEIESAVVAIDPEGGMASEQTLLDLDEGAGARVRSMMSEIADSLRCSARAERGAS